MKILYTDVLKEDYFVTIWYGVSFSLIALGFLVYQLIKIKKGKSDWGRVFLSIALVALISLFTYNTVRAVNEGVKEEYKATITDFNEVHDKGYEIVGREGEIYTLVKTKK